MPDPSPQSIDAANRILGAGDPKTESTYAAEQLLGPEPPKNLGGQIWDNFFSDPTKGATNKAFNKAYDEAYGKQPLGISPETEKLMKDYGIFSNYEKGQQLNKSTIAETLLRPAAVALDYTMRAMYATARGAAAEPWYRPERYIGGIASAALEGAFLDMAQPHLEPMRFANELGVLDDPRRPSPEIEARQRLAPTGVPSDVERVISPELRVDPNGVQTEAASPQSLHDYARQLEPDLFSTYDTLTETKTEYWNHLDDLDEARAESPQARRIQTTIDNILSRGPEEELSQGQRQRLAEARGALEEYLTTDTPEMAQARREMMSIDEQLRDMAPQVSDTLRRAREAMPEPPPAETIPPIRTGTVDVTPNPGGGFDISTREGEFYAKTEAEAQEILKRVGGLAEAGRDIATLAQRRMSVAQDVTQQLVAAGRSVEEARATAALVQSHYQARAARFGGALGTARDLYDLEAPSIKYSVDEKQRARISLRDNVITLGPQTDASSFVHESMHFWFEELLTDSKRPEAPPDLIEDVKALREWLGMQGERPTRAEHEQVARGFEKYLMEGVAPSSRLNSVFAKFKDWLTSIYQTLARIKAPLNDQIRGVYDRLLSSPNDTIIAPERELERDLGTTHQAEAQSTPPERAIEVADQMVRERDFVAQQLSTEINNARLRARNAAGAKPAAGSGGAGVGEAGGGGPELVSDRETPPEKPTAISPSGATFKAEGAAEPGGRRDQRLVDRAGNIRLDNLEAADDVNDAIRKAAEANDNYGLQTRSPMTWGQLRGLAEDLGKDPKFLDAKKIGDAYSGSEIIAARQLLKASAEEVLRRMEEAAESGDPIELGKAVARFEMIQGKVAGATAEWGRAGHAFRALSELSGEADFAMVDGVLKNTTGRGYDQLLQMARQGRNLSPAQVPGVIQASMWDKVKRGTVFTVTNGYLSGPYTHLGYVIGNEIRAGIMHPIEVAGQAALGTLRGASRDRVYWNEVGQTMYGFVRGSIDGWRPAVEAFRSGRQGPLPGQTRFSQPWVGFDSPFPDAITNIIGFPGKVVAAIHQFSRVQFYTQHLFREIARDATERGLDGAAFDREVERLKQNPPADLMAKAADAADRDMFQQELPQGSWVRKLNQYTETHPMAKLVFPFTTIGYNIMKEALSRRTIVGLASKEIRGELAAGGAMRDEAVAKMGIGMSIIGTGIGLGLSGVFTGPGPADPKQRSEWILTHQPNSLNIGNVSIPMLGLPPHFNLIMLGAGLAQAAQFAHKDEIDAIAKNYWTVIMHSVFDESIFHDFANLGEALSDPARNAPRWLAGFASGFMPFSSFLSQVNRHVIDPFSKETQPGIAGIWDNIVARLPYASLGLPDRRDMFGEPIPSRGMQGFGADLRQRYANDVTVQWLNRLGVGPGRLDHTIDTIRLTPVQYDDMARISGRLSKQLLDQARPQLESLPKGMQVKEVNRLIGEARHAGRQMLMQHYPQIFIDAAQHRMEALQ